MVRSNFLTDRWASTIENAFCTRPSPSGILNYVILGKSIYVILGKSILYWFSTLRYDQELFGIDNRDFMIHVYHIMVGYWSVWNPTYMCIAVVLNVWMWLMSWWASTIEISRLARTTSWRDIDLYDIILAHCTQTYSCQLSTLKWYHGLVHVNHEISIVIGPSIYPSHPSI